VCRIDRKFEQGFTGLFDSRFPIIFQERRGPTLRAGLIQGNTPLKNRVLSFLLTWIISIMIYFKNHQSSMFFKVKSTNEALEIIKGFPVSGTESICSEEGLNRILRENIRAPEDLPGFTRSTMDGYAVRAKDTFGATESMPAFLDVIGDIPMGQIPTQVIGPGQAAKIATGGMLPREADGVVMIEYCHALDEKTIEVSRAVSPLENVIQPSDDLKKGAVVLSRGKALRPQDIGVLAGLGITRLDVFKKPKIAIISTGDEVIPVDQKPSPGQVRDINSHALAAFCRKHFAEPIQLGLCPDHFEELKKLIHQGLEKADSVWISGGSSVGSRDMTLEVIESFPGAEVLVHGIAISPGKPTILSRLGNKTVWGLPGHAASSMVVAEVFLSPFLAALSGRNPQPLKDHQIVEAVLTRNIESAGGRDDYIRVKLIEDEKLVLAEPILGKSGLISPLVEADGLIRIDQNTEGLYQGQRVRVRTF
jgi:molybdopterin molybdotransferase